MHQQSNLLGSLWMVAAGLLFVVVTVIVRHLGSDLPAAEAAFIRYLFGLVFLTPVLFRMRWRRVTREIFNLYLFRGIAHGVAELILGNAAGEANSRVRV